MRRREFIAAFGGMAAWPLAARAQQRMQVRRIGALMPYAADDPQAQARNGAFLQGLQQLSWSLGQNLQIEYRWSGGRPADTRRYAAELAALAPEVILTPGSAVLAPMLQETRKVPIVFAIVPDPVGAGFIDSLARPGGNATGFMSAESVFGAKLLETLKEFAPDLTRAAVVRDPNTTGGIGYWGAISTAAPGLGVDVTPVNMREAGEIERAIAMFARSANGGMIVTGGALAVANRNLLVALAARHKLPAVYYERYFAVSGGLLSYGPDYLDQFRRTAGYVDRILKGEKPADLPVQAPTKFELVVNLKTAKAMGLTVPPSLLARADEVIE